MRRIMLYTYHIFNQCLSQTANLHLERDLDDVESRNEHELIFAVHTNPAINIRLAIASKPGVVYHDQDSETYRVWFDEPNRDKAIEAIGNYILDTISDEIKFHKSFIKRINEDKDRASKLLDRGMFS